jgi:hypothetical protein
MSSAETAFIHFIARHRRSYGTKEEYEYRLSLFTKVFEEIQANNAEQSSFKMGIN